MNEAERSPVLVLGLAGVNWTELVRRVSAKMLPGFSALLSRAAAGPLISHVPAVGPAAWATLATGRPPLDHGLVTPDEPWAGGLRPAGATSWHVPPLWVRLAEAGLHTGSVGWPASNPGASWPGDHVDDRFAIPHGETWDDWAMPHGQTPDALREDMRALRVHPHDVTGQMLLPFVPTLHQLDQSRNHGLVPLALALAQLSTEHAAASALIGSARHDVFFVQHDWLADIERGYANAASLFESVFDAAWTLLDQLVGQIAAMAADRTLIIAGIGSGGQPGALIAAGPEIARGKIAGANLVDIAPTTLARLGFADTSLPGRNLLPGAASLTPLPPADMGRTPAAISREDLDRVAAFGLHPPVAAAQGRASRLTQKAGVMLTADPRAARLLADEALALSPDDIGALGLKAATHVMLDEAAEIEPIAQKLASLAPDHPWLPLIQAADLVLRGETGAARPLLTKVEAQGNPDLVLRAGMLWVQASRLQDAERCARFVLEKRAGDIGAMQLLATSLSAKPAEAEAIWKGALALDPGNAMTRSSLEALLRSLGRSHEANDLMDATTGQ